MTVFNKIVLLLLLLVPFASAFVLQNQLASNIYYKAIDFTTPLTSSSQGYCFFNSGYSVAFLRGYTGPGNGAYDKNLKSNINYIESLHYEIYMSPAPQSTKSGSAQFNELFKGAQGDGILLKRVWIKVLSGDGWSSNTTVNVGILNDIATRAKQLGVNLALATNQNDWTAVTGGMPWYTSDAMLWYSNTLGTGAAGESSPDFSDFQPFAGFSKATVKQYATSENVCGANVNCNVYTYFS